MFYSISIYKDLKYNAVEYCSDNIKLDNNKNIINIQEYLNWFDKNNSFISNYYIYKE
jgi:hypothetical protein